MKTSTYHQLIAILLALATTTPSHAQLATGVRERRMCNAETITVLVRELQKKTWRIDRLVRADALRTAAREEAAGLYHYLKEKGDTQAALQFYSLIGGVITGMEFEAPVIKAIFSPHPKVKKDVAALQLALMQLCNLEDYEGDSVWIPQDLASYFSLPYAATDENSSQLFLRPGRSLWKAPGYAAQKMEDQTGPLLLYSYSRRTTANGTFYEVGSRPQPADTPFIAFVRETDAIPLPRTTCRVETPQNGASLTPLHTFRIDGNKIFPQSLFQLNTGATYLVLDDERERTSYLTLHIIQVASPDWLTRYPHLPFAVPSRDNRKEIR